ncbi:MAG: SAM-dependent chlorinase/fluorinase [Acidobacteriota bacterium]
MAGDGAPIVTLLTDFGLQDPWVGSLKGVLWSIQPAFRIVDLCHEVPPHDVFSGAFTLYRSYRDFPPWTIHLCVVDPGVGTARRPILVVTDDRYFIGPDNGIFSFVYQFETAFKVVHVTADHYFRKKVGQTFHGRDVFAPVAAWLSKGIDSSRFGEAVEDFVRLPVPVDRRVGDSLVKGELCGVDRFGNLLTNVRAETLAELASVSGRTRFKVLVAGQEVPLVDSGGYAQEAPLFALVGSAGLLEVAASQRSAAEMLGISGRGKEVGVMAF